MSEEESSVKPYSLKFANTDWRRFDTDRQTHVNWRRFDTDRQTHMNPAPSRT